MSEKHSKKPVDTPPQADQSQKPEKPVRLRHCGGLDYAVVHAGDGYTWTIGEESGTEYTTIVEAEQAAEAVIRTRV